MFCVDVAAGGVGGDCGPLVGGFWLVFVFCCGDLNQMKIKGIEKGISSVFFFFVVNIAENNPLISPSPPNTANSVHESEHSKN